MKGLGIVAWWLVVLGAVNWGLVGLGVLMGGQGWNVVDMFLGGFPQFEAFVYALVGISGLYLIWKKAAKSK